MYSCDKVFILLLLYGIGVLLSIIWITFFDVRVSNWWYYFKIKNGWDKHINSGFTLRSYEKNKKRKKI